MAYLSLYRKWRPQSFDDVVGQKHVVRTLVNALNDGRAAHAYLFCGPRGTGKTTVARLVAKGLNCELGPTGAMCNECENCRRIAQGTALDVIEIDGASNRGIDEVREIRERVHYAPTQAPYKVYIVDEVHMLTNEAFNALLKMLEEPPAHVVFIFATTEAHKIPATIISRCQKFDFRRFRPAELLEQLIKVVRGESVAFDEDALRLVARHAEGGMRDALAVLDQCIAYQPDRVSVEVVEEVLGTAPRDMLAAFVRALAAGEAGRALAQLQTLDETTGDLRQFARDVIGYLRDLMILKAAQGNLGASALVSLLDAERAEAEALAGQVGLDWILRAIERVSTVEADMRWSPTPVLAFEMAVVRLINGDEETQEVEAEPVVKARTLPPRAQPTKPAGGGEVAVQAPGVAGPEQPPARPLGESPRPGTESPAAPPKSGADRSFAARSGAPGQSPSGATGAGDSAPGRGGRSDSSGPVFAQWDELLETLRSERLRQAEAFLREGRPVELTDTSLVVVFPENRQFHYANMSKPEHRQACERILSRMLRREIQLDVVLGSEYEKRATKRAGQGGPAGPPHAGREPGTDTRVAGDDQSKSNLAPEDLNNPTLNAALKLFKGTVMKVEQEE